MEAAIDGLIAALDALDAPGEDLEDSDDRAENESSLAATLDIDQRIAWAYPAFGVIDGEATGAADDIGARVDLENGKARRAATAKAHLRTILARRRSRTEARAQP